MRGSSTPRDPKNFERAITPKTRAIFVETIGNPVLDFTDVKAIADVAHRNGLPLIVDGTFTTPFLLKTIDLGADIVVNSLTKWIGGHGSAVGGIITDAGRFDWGAGRHRLFTEPDANYHGLRWAIDLPEVARADRLRPAGKNGPAAQSWRLHFPGQLVDIPPGHRIAPCPHGPAFGKCACGRDTPCKASEGVVGAVSRPCARPVLSPGKKIPYKRVRRNGGVRDQRRL